tara:strand:- start:1362 stop:2120 length:759 start_codon:yes stop_codon:yes gene_type:complete
MSITLKRPMFRKGGDVEEGIMELATPRRNYNEGKTREEIFAEAISGLTPEAQKYAQSMSQLAGLGRTSNQDLLTNVLIQGGLRGMSTAGKGGTLANLAAAFEAPVGQALKQRQANKMLDIQGAMKGLELGSKVDIAERKALLKKQFESGTVESITKSIETILGKDAIGDARQLAVNLSPFVTKGRRTPGVRFAGILPVDAKTGEPNLSPKFGLARQPNGTVYVHPFQQLFYVVQDGKLELADQETLKLPTEE